MNTCRMEIDVPESHEIMVRLPADFPIGRAEVIVIAETRDAPGAREETGSAAADFEAWLIQLLRTGPAVPPLPREAFDRSSIYDE